MLEQTRIQSRMSFVLEEENILKGVFKRNLFRMTKTVCNNKTNFSSRFGLQPLSKEQKFTLFRKNDAE